MYDADTLELLKVKKLPMEGGCDGITCVDGVIYLGMGSKGKYDHEKKCGRAKIEKILPFAAVQRLVQCLGAYGRLASVGQPQFCKWVLPALQNLLSAADDAGLDAVGALAEDLIAEMRRSHGHEGCSCGHGHKRG